MEAVRGLGGVVEAVGCLIDRSGGVDLGVPMRSLVKLDVPTYGADACPLCAAGGTPVKPGSRGLR
jgi:orotate phosphoribosyltransferase